MKHCVLPIALAAAALLTISACQTTGSDAADENITWNTPEKPETRTQPPPPSQPVQRQASAPPEPQCREYQTTITIGGTPQKAYGRACRQPDGTWKNVGDLKDTPHSKEPGSPVEDSYPYGWHGYDYPDGPRYGPGGLSVGVGAGTGGGWFGYGVGF